MKKLVVLSQAMTSEQEEKFAEYLDSKLFGYWHWISGGWLLYSPTATAEAVIELRDKLSDEIAPGTHCLVFEVATLGTYAGYGPSKKGASDMFPWLDEHWNMFKPDK